MKKLLLLLLTFAAGAALALVVIILGVEPPRGGDVSSGAGDGETGWLEGSAPWDGDDADEGGMARLGGGDGRDPLDPLGAWDPEGEPGEDADASPRGGRGRRRGGGRGEGGSSGRASADEEEARSSAEPDPGGRHLEELQSVLDTGDAEKLRMFLVSTTSVRGTELGEAEAAVLLGALGDLKHAGLQSAILMHLERIGGDGVTEGLVSFLKEKRPSPVVSRTLESLGRINSPASVSALVAALASPDLGRNRRAAAEVLARRRSPLAIAPLSESLSSADPSTRQLAAASLVRFGTEASYEAVLSYARSGDAADRNLGRRLLEKSARGPAAVSVLGPALQRERDPTLRASAARILSRSRDPRAGRFLLDAARADQVPAVRVEAVNALARTRDRSYAAEVQRIATEDPHKGVQRAAQRALRQLTR